MEELRFDEKNELIQRLLLEKELKVECYSKEFNLVRKTNNWGSVRNFIQCECSPYHNRGLKDVSIEIPEIEFKYYTKFSPLGFEDELISKLQEI